MLRNKELRLLALTLLALGAVSCAAGFAIAPAAGLLALASSAAFAAAFWAFTRARYRRLAELTEQIDLVLHNPNHLLLGEDEEGELSLLQSEITKMTLRIREQNDALRQEKTRLSDSLADVAHQLRTPLTSLSLILSLLPKAADEAEQKALLREAEELLVQMDWLLGALLKLSRLDAGIVSFKREPVDVRSLLRTAARPLSIAMELHDIALRTEIPEGASLSGDFDWLSEAIRNILKNCMESAGDGGRIDVACEVNPLYTEITIRDSGPGFQREDLPRLFERFYRGRNSGAAGYGIGLALCRTIIVSQGGTVSARNHPRGGALFSIRFPK